MEPTVFLIALVAFISVCSYCLYYFTKHDDIELELEEKDLEVEEPMVVEVEEPIVVEVTEEAVVTPAKLNRMTKAQIEDYGRIHGVELDRRKTKANMIADLLSATGG